MKAYVSEHLTANPQDDVLVIRFHVRELRGDELVAKVQEELIELVRNQQADRVVLDLEEVDVVSSRGLGGLAAFHRELCRARGGKVALCNLNEMVAQTFLVTRFIDGKGAGGPLARPLDAPERSTSETGPLFQLLAKDVSSAVSLL